MSAHLDLGESATEFLRGNWGAPAGRQATAVRAEVRQQLVQYVPEVRQLGGLDIFCLCENEQLLEVAREEAAEISRVHQVNLSVVPILERNVFVAPPRPDRPEVWRRLFLPLEFYLEYERSATTSADIRDKLMPYFRVARRGVQLPCDCHLRDREGRRAVPGRASETSAGVGRVHSPHNVNLR